VTQIYACSSNAGKLRDFALVAGELGLTGLSLLPLPALNEIAPPEETGDTFERNACAKALYYSHFTDEIVLADDSGLEVAALGGAPGIHSARYAGPGATDEANNLLLTENMSGQTNRDARFVCAIALAKQGSVMHVVRAAVKGQLLERPRGTNGFGYDPLFFYPPFEASFGELDESRKFNVSHRGNALRDLLSHL
jgi:XTP/dITP diphosphohydrolase